MSKIARTRTGVNARSPRVAIAISTQRLARLKWLAPQCGMSVAKLLRQMIERCTTRTRINLRLRARDLPTLEASDLARLDRGGKP